MNAADLKALKRLAAICRKAGILHFKNEQFEFTLTEEAPVALVKAKKNVEQTPAMTPNVPFTTDTLTAEELLFWSTGAPIDEAKGTE